MSLLADQIKKSLKTQSFGTLLHIFRDLPSTNNWAAERARDGALHGEVIIADQQSTGKGRMGRQWLSPAGKNIYLTVITHPARATSELPQLTIVAGVAIAEALSAATGKKIQIKWPNDLCFEGRKLGGILCEAIAVGSTHKAVLIGIGINVNWHREDFPSEIKALATSVWEISGEDCNRNELIAALLNSLEKHYQAWLSGAWAALCGRANELNVLQGRRVQLQSGKESLQGTVSRIDPAGYLELELPSGQRQSFLEGDTTIL